MDDFKNTTRMKIMGKQSGGRVSAPVVPITRRTDEPNVSVGGVGGGYGPSYGGATGPAMRAGDAAARFASSGTLAAPRGPARGVGLNVRIPLKKGGEAKVGKVMDEYKSGKLHSGSKEGPKVTNPKQAKAIALSEARKAGADIPMKKAMGGAVARRMPSPAASAASGNRMSKMDAEDLAAVSRTTKPSRGDVTESEMRRVRRKVETKAPRDPRMPLIGERIASGDRMSRMEAAEARAMGLKKGGLAAMPKGKC